MYLSSRFMQRADSGSRPRLQALLDSATLWLKDQVGCEVCVCVCAHVHGSTVSLGPKKRAILEPMEMATSIINQVNSVP